MSFKEKVYSAFLDSITRQVTDYQKNLDDLAESAANETKSTAGDKHETALAMLQIEQRNIKGRLAEAQEKKKLLEKISPVVSSLVVVKGSLVQTNLGYFYLSVALGKIEVERTSIMAISPVSPLGSKLLGLKMGDKVDLNANAYFIQSIE